MEDELSLVARAGHPLADRESLSETDLAGARWVLPERGTPTREALEAALERRGFASPRIRVETTDLTITRGLLIESDMLTAASPHLFRQEIEARQLGLLRFALPETRSAVGILQRNGGSLSLPARLLMDSIREVGRV